jgi:glycosyl transferase, family 25
MAQRSMSWASGQLSNQFDTLFDSFVISLKRTPERLQLFRTQNSKCGIDFRHFEASDGAQIEASEVEGRIVAKGAVMYKPGAIGNAMSHLSLWHRCAEQTKAFIVLEDDAVVRNDVKAKLIATIPSLGAWDIVLLGYNLNWLEMHIAPGILYGGVFSVPNPSSRQLSDYAASTDPVGLYRLNSAIGICGYVISPSGARILMQSCFPMDNRPVIVASLNHKFLAYGLDCMMATVYPKIGAYVSVAPLVMTANNNSTSTVQR